MSPVMSMAERRGRELSSGRARRRRLALVAAALMGAVGVALVLWSLRVGRGIDRTPVLDVVCTETGWRARVPIRGDWRVNPQTGRGTCKLAAACPRCGRVMPFLDDELFLKDSQAALNWHAKRVFPMCPTDNLRCRPYWSVFVKEIRIEHGKQK